MSAINVTNGACRTHLFQFQEGRRILSNVQFYGFRITFNHIFFSLQKIIVLLKFNFFLQKSLKLTECHKFLRNFTKSILPIIIVSYVFHIFNLITDRRICKGALLFIPGTISELITFIFASQKPYFHSLREPALCVSIFERNILALQ